MADWARPTNPTANPRARRAMARAQRDARRRHYRRISGQGAGALILGYAGHGAIGLLDGIYNHTDRIRHIQPRIEQTAGFMADVYYRLTGQPLAVYASTGPGR